MTQLFKPKDNDIFRAVIVGTFVLLIVALMYSDLLQGSSYLTRKGTDVEQPIPFSHKHHVGGLGIDCRFCHTSVEKSSYAGIPSTEICMKCHREIWKDSPVLEPVRRSFRTGKPLVWNRVHNLPDFVYFNHSIHVHKGISCLTCHGQVDRMSLMHKEHTLYMSWCLNCHQHPGNYIGPVNKVFDMRSKEPKEHSQRVYYSPYHIKQITNCSACHH